MIPSLIWHQMYVNILMPGLHKIQKCKTHLLKAVYRRKAAILNLVKEGK